MDVLTPMGRLGTMLVLSDGEKSQPQTDALTGDTHYKEHMLGVGARELPLRHQKRNVFLLPTLL